MIEHLKKFWVNNIQKVDRGFSYIPGLGEYRASQIPYCPKKQILRKKPEWMDPIVLDLIIPDKLLVNDPVALGSNQSGNAIHENVQNTVKKSIETFAIEKKVKSTFFGSVNGLLEPFTIGGHIDLILLLGNKLCIVDIKTFKRVERYPAERYMPNEKYLDQLAIYMGLTGIKKGFILYINREDFEPLFYDIDRPDIRFTNMLKKCNEMLIHETNATLPETLPKEYKKYTGRMELNWECNYCEFKDYCFQEED
ncbi:MAG: PD-(D/E)XK nuclease family protein [Cocleimonas sp.]